MSSATPSIPLTLVFIRSNYLTAIWGGGAFMFITLKHLSAERIQHKKVNEANKSLCNESGSWHYALWKNRSPCCYFA